MLYNPSTAEYSKQENFIFDATPYNEDIDFNKIVEIERFYDNNGYIKEEDINNFLNYLIYYTRINICNPAESPLTFSMKSRCAPAANIIYELCKKMNIEVDKFNIGDMFNTHTIHELTKISIPTIIDNKKDTIQYILDPTFRQFCLEEENRFHRYFEEPRYGVRMSTPHPGYFLKLNKKGTEFANNLITYGYFEINEDNIKTYFDAFRLYLTPKEEYTLDNLGLRSSTNLTSYYYLNRIEDAINIDKKYDINYRMNVKTPIEIDNEYKRTIKYKLIKLKEKFSQNKSHKL